MPYTIGAYVSVKGEKDFTAAMRDLKKEMGYTKAESDALTSAYDQNDKSAEAVKARSDGLEKALALQKKAVEAAKKSLTDMTARGLTPADEAYKEMEKNLHNLQTQANKTERELNQIGDTSEDNAKKINESGSSAFQAFQSGNWSNLLGGAAGLVTEFAAIGTAAIKAAEGIAQLAKEAAGDADDILTKAAIMGVDTATYQKLQYASNFVDVSVDDMSKAMQKIEKLQQQVTADSGRMFVGDTGYSILVGYGEQMMDTLDVFYRVIDDLGKIDDEMKRDAIASELFGKSYRELLPLINAGSEALREYGEAAENKGYIMSDDELANLGSANDKLDEMAVAMDELKREFIKELLPAIQKVLDALLLMINYISEVIRQAESFRAHANQFGMVGGSVGADEFASNMTPIL